MKAVTHSAPIMVAEQPLLAETVAQTIMPAPRPVMGQFGTVVIGRPVSALGALLQAGVSPGDALLAWSASARALLADLDRAKGKISVAIAPHLGGELVIGRRTLSCPADGVAPWWVLAAGQLLDADEGARNAAAALAAHARLDPGASLTEALSLTADLQRLFATGAEATSPNHTRARLAVAINAINGLQSAVTQQIDELARITDARAEAEHELFGLRDQVARHTDLQAQVDGLISMAERLRQAQHLRESVLGAQVLDAMAEQQRLRDHGRRLEDWGRGLQTEIDALRAELDRVYGSKSWRVTSPLRSLRHKMPSA